jgi:site-specific DNA-cytosine methylase
MNVLELFSGTGSVGKCCKELGLNVISLDLLLPATHQIDIMNFDYKQYPKDHFGIIWASPPCTEYSKLQDCWLNKMKKGVLFTKEVQEENMKQADKLVLKTLEIIEYFKPNYWFMENPLGKMKDREIMKDKFYHIVDYCMYSDWGYRKRTCIWTNKTNWNAKVCNKDCGNMVGNLHKNNIGNTKRRKATNGVCFKLHDRYRVPPDLIYSLFLE